jgi:hypothetical protein
MLLRPMSALVHNDIANSKARYVGVLNRGNNCERHDLFRWFFEA